MLRRAVAPLACEHSEVAKGGVATLSILRSQRPQLPLKHLALALRLGDYAGTNSPGVDRTVPILSTPSPI